MAKSSASAGSPSSKSLLFMMIAMTAGFCILLGGGMLMASRVIGVLGLRSSSDQKTVRTPLGEFRYEKAKEVGPGLPVYPGASLVLAGAAAGNTPATDEQPQVLSSTYHTNTSREYVATWYVEHLSPEFARQDSGPKNLPEGLRGSHISDDDIAFLGERGEQVRVVALTIDQTGTKITLLRSYTKPPAQASAAPQAQ
jgi:hypothetical protein